MRYVLGAMTALFLTSGIAQAACGSYTASVTPKTTVADSGNPISTPVRLPETETRG